MNITPLTPALSPNNPLSPDFKLLDNQTLPDALIIRSLNSESAFGSLLYISEEPETNLLMVIYSDGKVRYWNVLDEKVALTVDIHFLEPSGDFLDASNQLVLSANEYIPNPHPQSKTNHLVNGFSVYDLQTGEIINCLGFNCASSSFSDFVFGETGGSLSPDGKWIASFVNSSISIFSVTLLENNSMGSVTNLEEDLSRRHISQLTFGPSGDILAIANEEGGIEVYPFDKKTGVINLSHDLVIEAFGTSREGVQPVEHLLIDNTQNWIAKAQGRELSIWSLTNPTGQPVITIEINPPSNIAFDRTGKLFFVAFNNYLWAYSLENNELIYSTEIPAISAIYVSRDNRLLVLGNTLGAIFLVAVPTRE